MRRQVHQIWSAMQRQSIGLFGNNQNNILDGAAGDDSLFGFGGDDTLIGGLGKDSMWGGLGNDVYRVDNMLDGDQRKPERRL